MGDPKQLRGVGCGSLFGYLHKSLDGPSLTQNRRQHEEDERTALGAYRAGRYTDALQSWAQRGRVVAEHTSAEGIAAMVSTWMRLSQGAPDDHTHTAGLVMLAATNEQVTRINQAVQAVRAAEGQLAGDGHVFTLPDGRQTRFHVGDHVLIRRNDRYQQVVEGEAVLNGYRGVVTAVTDDGVSVEWRQPGDHPGQDPHAATLPRGFIAAGGLELGYCLTTHKAEGMTISGSWERPDGTRNDGSVLVWTPGMDNPGLYVAASRHRGAGILFGSLEELEGEREQRLYGTPADQEALTGRVIDALAARAQATASSANDRPVLADLGHDLGQAPMHPAARVARMFKPPEPKPAPAPPVPERWRERPHASLDDRQLGEAITAAARERAEHRAAARQTRRLVDKLADAVAAGRGPAVTALDARLGELRRRAQLHERAVELGQQWLSADSRAHVSARRAHDMDQEASQVSRLRPGRRDRLQAQADQLHTQAAQHRQLADQLDHQRAQLCEQLGVARVDRIAAEHAVGMFRRAELDYPQDHQQAERSDHNQLAVLRRRVGEHTNAADDTAIRHGQLLTEQQLRNSMPAEQRAEESVLRARWATERALAKRQRQQARRDRDAGDYDHLRRTQQRNQQHGRDRDGPSLGL